MVKDKESKVACRVCGRVLKNPESIAAGIGPVCAGPSYKPRSSIRKADPNQMKLNFEKKEKTMSDDKKIIHESQNPSTAVKNELTKIEVLKRTLADEGALYDEKGDIDAKFLLDTIEGETDLHDMLLEIDDSVAEYEAKADAIKIRIEAMQKRKARMERSADTLRTIIMSAMDRAGIQKIEGPVSTLSVKNKPRALIVTNESLIPSDYFEINPKLDRKKLIADLKEEKKIEGAELDNGGISLQIRRA